MKSLLLLMFFVLTLSGCSFLRDNPNTLKLGTQYAVLKILENSGDAVRSTRAHNIVTVTTSLKAVNEGTATTIPLLKEAALAQLGNLHLSPADQFLANTLIDAVVSELLKRVGDGLIKPDDKVIVSDVLQWVIDAAASQIPASSTV